MQSKGCLAVRNLVGRNEELRAPLLAEGAERTLQDVLLATHTSPLAPAPARTSPLAPTPSPAPTHSRHVP
jgi:hypothetical protein